MFRVTYYIVFCFVLLGFSLFGQNVEKTAMLLEKKDSIYTIDTNIGYFVDESRLLEFNEVKNKNFQSFETISENYQATHWFKFTIEVQKEIKNLTFFSMMSDNSDVYIPHKDSYRHFSIGTLVKSKKTRNDIGESAYITIPIDSIDFSKPFYFNKKVITSWGRSYLQLMPSIVLTDNLLAVDGIMQEGSLTKTVTVYSGIFLLSFMLFFINYLITKDVNFLNYSFYLLVVTLIFAVRIPLVFNFSNQIHPSLINHIRMLSQVTSSGLYLYFIIVFLNFKKHYPISYKLSLALLKGIVIFGVLNTILLLINPFFRYRFLIFGVFIVIFTLLTLGIFTRIIFRKTDLTTKIVMLGSFLLIIGNILSFVYGDFRFFLNTAVVEIILFSSIISYKNKLDLEKNINNQMILAVEKKEKLALIELDTMKSNFFTNISHEFRTPITLISGPIQDQLKKEDISDEERKTFQMIHRNANRLNSLVNQLLDISKIELGKLKLKVSKNNLTPLIGALTDSFSYVAKQKDLNYLIYNSPPTAQTWFDRDVLEKIVVNLISNAIKYTPNKGSVVFNSFVEEDQLFVEVKNTGPGLTKKNLTEVFERFYQIDESTQGVGIGLALVKELVNLHKGTISIESTPNEWTIFTVKLPISFSHFEKKELVTIKKNKLLEEKTSLESVAEPIKNTEVKNNAKSSEKQILLIVDDNPDVRTYVGNLFNENYTILFGANGKEGIDLAIEHVPDLILSDVMMPVSTGIELCETLKLDERTSHIPIILLTAKVGDENEFLGIKTGADDYISKPFKPAFLQLKVTKLLESRKALQKRYSQEVTLRPKDIAITSIDEQFLERLQIVLDDKLVESSFSIEQFSQAVNMSRMQLHRKLKALTGLSASEFVRSQRLKLAAQLLEKSDVNISQIGYSVGFNDPAYFSKCFKELYHCTPTEYVNKSK